MNLQEIIDSGGVLNNRTLTLDDLALLAEHIRSDSCAFQLLDLSNSKITDAGLIIVVDALTSIHHQIKHVALSNNNIGDAGATHIAGKLIWRGDSEIETIDIRGNNISNDVMQNIVKILPYSTQLKQFDYDTKLPSSSSNNPDDYDRVELSKLTKNHSDAMKLAYLLIKFCSSDLPIKDFETQQDFNLVKKMWVGSFNDQVFGYASGVLEQYISLYLPKYLEFSLAPEIRGFIATFVKQTEPFRIPAKLESLIESYRKRLDLDMNEMNSFESEFYSEQKMMPLMTEIFKANFPSLGMEYYQIFEYLDDNDRAALACVCKNFTLPPKKKVDAAQSNANSAAVAGGGEHSQYDLPELVQEAGKLSIVGEEV